MANEDWPEWANDLAEQYFGGTLCEFVIHGSIHDKVKDARASERHRHPGLKRWLGKRLLGSHDVVIHFDPSSGVTFRDPEDAAGFQSVLAQVDGQKQTQYASSGAPREPSRALYLIERYMRAKIQGQIKAETKAGKNKNSVALVIEYADLVLPAGDPSNMSMSQQATLVTLLRWAKDPEFLAKHLIVLLIAENPAQLNKTLVESPFIGRTEIKLPDAAERLDYLKDCFARQPALEDLCKIDMEQFATLTGGLSRVNLNHVVRQAAATQNQFEITAEYVGRMKRELIEKECFGMLEFLSSPYGLDTVCGHEPQKEWLRSDARLIREGRVDALPMGYLICGPVGTGKSFMAQCFTHDIGIPCVRLKNFRDKWYGSTEANWQKILSVLKAAGPVGVVIDEADAAVGDRSSGHEVSNRVFSMLATEMGDTRNRGHILWFLLTSRPDLLPVDIKRQGRAEVHIPLFYPDTEGERRQMREVLVKKCGLKVAADALDMDVGVIAAGGAGEDDDDERDDTPSYTPDDPRNIQVYMREAGLSGAEIESILIRSKRRAFLEGREVIEAEDLRTEGEAYIPNLAKTEIELQILVAILECSDKRFLPERLARLDRGQVRGRMLAILRAMTSNVDIATA